MMTFARSLARPLVRPLARPLGQSMVLVAMLAALGACSSETETATENKNESKSGNAGDDQALCVLERAAELLGNRRAEQPEFAHFAEDGHVGRAVAERLDDARLQLVLAIGRRGVAHHAFVVTELGLEQERILPVECRVGHAVAPGLVDRGPIVVAGGAGDNRKFGIQK